jgi:hypothetical protein
VRSLGDILSVSQVNAPTREQLLGGAKYHADLALRAYTSGESRAILVNAALSMEHLSKALLFSMNPAFLVELRNGRFDSLLHLTGHGDRAKPDAMRTISGREAVERVCKITAIGTPREPLERLIQIRDGVVHAAAYDAPQTRELLTMFVRYSDEVYEALAISDGWGKHSELVFSLVEQSRSETEHEFNRKVTAARARLRELMDEIPRSEQTAVASARQQVLYDLANRVLQRQGGQVIIGVPLNCPVCNHARALCVGPIREEHELVKTRLLDMSEELRITDVWVEPNGLVCRVCGVALQGAEEMRLAGVSRLEINDEFWLPPIGSDAAPPHFLGIDMQALG